MKNKSYISFGLNLVLYIMTNYCMAMQSPSTPETTRKSPSTTEKIMRSFSSRTLNALDSTTSPSRRNTVTLFSPRTYTRHIKTSATTSTITESVQIEDETKRAEEEALNAALEAANSRERRNSRIAACGCCSLTIAFIGSCYLYTLYYGLPTIPSPF